jgi:uncharacterized HAD superfamily protein
MTIATDIDEVLADTLNEFLKFYNTSFRTDFNREQFGSYDWWEALKISADEFILRLHKFIDEGGFARVVPVPGAGAGIKTLSRDHKLLAVTSRPRALSETTADWLGRHFAGCFNEVYYTKELIGEKNRVSKVTFCLQEGVDLFIDDVYEYAAGCAARGIEALLYDAPWNKDAGMISNMTRVFTWDDIIKNMSERLDKAAAGKPKTYYEDRIKI